MGQHYCLFDTAIGPCGIAWNERGLTRLRLPESSPTTTEKRLRATLGSPAPATPPLPIEAAIAELQRYFAGARIEFGSIVLDLPDVDAFHRQVYEAARSVAWGQTTTYGELARQAGAPQEAREVGQAMARNPIPIIIPCHRVLAAGGRMGGYSGRGAAATKRFLLELEGARPPADETGQLPLPLP